MSKWKLIEFYHGRNTGTEKNLRDERRLKNDSKERETERKRTKKYPCIIKEKQKSITIVYFEVEFNKSSSSF